MKAVKYLALVVCLIIACISLFSCDVLSNIETNNNDNTVSEATNNNSTNETTCGEHSHSFSSWTTTTAPSCTAQGMQTRACSSCGFSEYSQIAKLDHTEVVDKAVAATCTTFGKTEGKHCSICNTVLVAQDTIPSSHIYDDENDTACNVCGAIRTAINTNDFVTATGYAYILYPVEVRKSPDNFSVSVGVAAWGSSVTIMERNAVWSKIKFSNSGVSTKGYVRNELLTTDAKKVTLKLRETPLTAKIAYLGNKLDGTPYSLNVRTTPWDCSKSEEYTNINVLDNIRDQKYVVKDGDIVEKLGTTEDGQWTYIRFTKFVDGVERVETGWCMSKYVSVVG